MILGIHIVTTKPSWPAAVPAIHEAAAKTRMAVPNTAIPIKGQAVTN